MLGRAADAFFARQKHERIIAAAPNGDGRSLILPDRGDSGSTAISRVAGNYEMPGPQNTFVQPSSGLPGMGCGLPGMGSMPGMGEDDQVQVGPDSEEAVAEAMADSQAAAKRNTMLLLGGVVAGIFLLRGKKRRK